ncbi:pyruvate dehydrogenase complex dihydrolipoamide acetyltransferase [Mesorhizobium sp. B1-1-4]|uniref:pyruvate dehydrogenase complex dihydrolipoamide acetyltransferase n=1 Tax=unclassified Mesorhizobium TaxID=325217 RepID=UPI001126DF34|nr:MULTISPECIES: pyruvate dehydrogenase complex dihydrolipoamide acetyltransferase [unclassified Mesorhizobium]MCA0001525.1 pyruvate dehydrogenase complex dihydrolipoamide acetyltransferase [Mesorhizobium sp. B264B2A]MCA0007632.1 pyruvate dehydrogenase complex dihydrolipoamide acetyltransferase [Mesorhizobium sp. B264B1B]TPJ39525.1 pyruvate dehydrogenase complex dihydrolipoamide acetyltransferase [Mesorhizobium sp. B2-6-6]TPN44697.1 pyruvate dehydrogenase complex dihydrolipoamide acetyltransfer
MPTEVILPKVDMDMATGQISRWFAEEGARVKKGDVLFEIETDKAAMEIDAPASGILRDVSGKEGVDIPVGAPVAWIYADDESYGAKQDKAPISPLEGEMSTKSTEGVASEGTALALSPVEPTPPDRPSAGHPPLEGEGKTRATPLARRLAREAGLNLSGISGTGPHGRVVKADIDAVLSSPLEGEVSAKRTEGVVSGGTAFAPSPVEATPPDRPAAGHSPLKGEGDVLRLFEEGSYDLVPHDNMRKTIARRLVEAKTTIPHFYLTLDCELDALLSLRTQLNAAAPVKKTDKGEAPAYKLSVNDMVIKAMAMALKAVPDANASWTESAMVKHRHADVGVAVSIPGGLITPIIRKADQKTLSVISNEMKDLASRARSRKLKPEEYQGGTTAVSNLGMFGIKDFAAVINPPHATILAVGAGEERAVAKNGEIRIATVMSVTLSTDHRAVDGALGAELLVAFKKLIENPMGMLV